MPTEPTIHSPVPRESAERGTAVATTRNTTPTPTTPAGAAMTATTATPVAPAAIIGEQEGNANGKRPRAEESGPADGLNASRGKAARQKGAGIGPAGGAGNGLVAEDPVTIDRILEKAKLMQVSRALQTRLQYARLKVEHGWTRNTLNEVEDMFKRDVQKHTRAAAAAREAAATLTAAANGSLYVSKPPLPGHHDEHGRRRNSTGAEQSSYVPKTPSTPTRNNPHFTRVTTPESSTRRWPPAGASFSVPTPPAAAIDWDDDGDSEDGIPSAAQAAHTILMLSSPRHSTPTNNRPHYDFTARSPTPTPTLGASSSAVLRSDPDIPTRSTVFSWQHQPPGSTTPTPQRVMTAPPPPPFGPVEIHHHHVHLHHSPSTPTHPRYLDHSPTFPSPSPTAQPQLTLRGPRMGSFSRDPKDPALASASTPSVALSAAPSLRWKHVEPTMFEESGAKQIPGPGGPGVPGQGLIPTTPPSIPHPGSSVSPVSSRSGSSAAGSPPGAPTTYHHHPPRPPPAPINDQFRITEFVSVNGAAVNRTPGARGKNSIAAVQAKEREKQERERLEREERERAMREGREPVFKVEEGEDRKKEVKEGKNKGRRRS